MVFLFLLLLLTACAGGQAAPAPQTEPTRQAAATAAGQQSQPASPTPAQTGAGVSPTPASAVEPSATPVATLGARSLLYVMANIEAHPPTSELWRLDFADGTQQKLVTCENECSITGLAVSPDGRQVAYAVNRPGSEHGLFMVGIDGSGNRLLVAGDITLGGYGFSTDGSQIAFVRYQSSQAALLPAQVLVVSASGGEPRQLTDAYNSVTQPAWIDESRLIVGVGDGLGEAGQTLLLIADASTAPQVLAEGRMVALSADRSRLLLAGAPLSHDPAPDQRFSFRALRLEQGRPAELAELQLPVGAAAWSPDGTRLLLSSMRGLSLLELASEREESLLSLTGKEGGLIHSPAWSPDGTSVLYALPVAGQAPVTEIRQVNLADGSEQVLVSVPGTQGMLLELVR